MKNLMERLAGFLWLSTFVFIFAACDKDDEEPTTAILRGTITVENGQVWQQYQDSGEVQLTLFPEYSLDPPAGWGDVPDGFFGPGVPGGNFALGAPYNAQNPRILEYEDGKDRYTYELEVEPGNYSALALGFRHDNISDPSLRTATVGVYWGNPATVSHGVQIRADVGTGTFVPILDYPAPEDISVAAGDNVQLDFAVDFAFLPIWFMQ